MLHQLLGTGTVLGCERDANARAGSDLVAEHTVRLSERMHQALGQLRCLGLRRGAGLEDREFVAAQAGHEIGCPQHLAQALGDALQ
jgi:hypothetical protein